MRKVGHGSEVEVDYAELRDPATLEPARDPLAGPVLLALAVRFCTPDAAVRLIDNRVLLPAPQQRSALATEATL